jgi:hypothetical protein
VALKKNQTGFGRGHPATMRLEISNYGNEILSVRQARFPAVSEHA